MLGRSGSLTSLLAPGRLGPLELRNRVVMPAMDQNLCTPDGQLTEDVVAHYEARAAGGAALLILETSAVAYPVGATSRHQPSLATDECIAGLTELADRVHARGAKLLVQMCHHGKTAGVDVIEGRASLVPSLPLPELDPMGMAADLTMDEMMKMGARFEGRRPEFAEATTDDLAWVVERFADAAARVERSGCDGVEIHAAHGYLLSTFLSPCWNRRDDDYGGNVERRARLLREVVEAVRARTSDDFALVVRIDGAEYRTPTPGITSHHAARHAVIAARAGADAVHVSAIGSPDSGVAFTDGPLPWRPAQYRGLARTVKAAVDVPVIAVGRIDPATGDRLIADGDADFVAMGRQLLADPELAERLISGRPDLVRPCINCFVCVAENFWDATPRCAVNARLGRRAETEVLPTVESRRIVVAGGGPAGMECARVAASRGHRVTVLERAPVLGGTARFSSLTSPINGELVAYLTAALDDLGVDVRLGVEATVDSLVELEPDAVVVATGASRDRPDVPGADADNVLSGDDLRGILTGDDADAAAGLHPAVRMALRVGHTLRVTRNLPLVRTVSGYWMPIGRNVVVVGGGLVGIELAEFLAERGRTVTVLEPGPALGVEMAHPRRWRALHEARSNDVGFETGAELVEIGAAEVTYRVGDDTRRAVADHVVIAGGVRPDPAFAGELGATGVEVHVIGDAAVVGYIEGAIRSGYDLGARL